MTGVLIKQGKFEYRGRHTHRKDDVKTHREKMAMELESESRMFGGRNSFQLTAVPLVPRIAAGTS